MRPLSRPRRPRALALLLALPLTGGATTAAVLHLSSGQDAVLQPVAAQAAAPAPTAAAPAPEQPAPTAPYVLPEDPEVRALQQLVDARAKAVLSHDRAAFLATVDPGRASFRRSQARVLDALAQVPLSAWSYDLQARTPHPEAVDRAVLDRGGSARALEGIFRYGLRGAEDDPEGTPRKLTFTRRGTRWYVSGDEAEVVDGAARPFVWETGPVAVVRGRSSLVLGHPGSSATMRRLAAAADAAVPRVTAVWGRHWRRHVVVVLPSTQRELGTLVGGGSFAHVAAVTTSDANRSGSFRHVAHVYVNPVGLDRYDALARRTLLTHEVLHVAARPSKGRALPEWLSEGLADYAGYRATPYSRRLLTDALARHVRAGRGPTHLATYEDFHGGVSRVDQAYESSWLAVELLVRRYGAAKTLELYRAVGAVDSGAEAAVVDDQLHRVLGTSTKRFTADWRRYLRTQLG